MELDLGSVPTWLAFVAASIAVGFTWRALVRERKRDALRELNERKAQADKFAAWLDREEREKRENGDFVLMLRNASHLPIYDANMHILNLQDNLTVKKYSRPVVVPNLGGVLQRLDPGVLNHPGFAGDSVSWEGWGHVEKIWELPEGAAGPCCSDGGGGSVGACFGVGGH